jgi:hypothetical protein
MTVELIRFERCPSRCTLGVPSTDAQQVVSLKEPISLGREASPGGLLTLGRNIP